MIAMGCNSHDLIPGSRVRMDAPKGFRTHREANRLHLSSGKFNVVVEPLDRSSAKILRAQARQALPSDPRSDLIQLATAVRFGQVSGTKSVLHQTKPVFYKRVEYILDVPGGHVRVILDAGGPDFDEGPIESQLRTLQVVPPKPPPTQLTPAPLPAKTQP
jgi:hypothetical protein